MGEPAMGPAGDDGAGPGMAWCASRSCLAIVKFITIYCAAISQPRRGDQMRSLASGPSPRHFHAVVGVFSVWPAFARTQVRNAKKMAVRFWMYCLKDCP